jgi:uncharacterized protein involved in copper resistance
MKLMRRNRNRWSVAFTLVFAVQLLASSLCISTAAQAVETTADNHCHESRMHAGMPTSDMQAASMQQEENAMDHSMAMACTHCASPENYTLFVNGLDVSPTDLLLAFVVVDRSTTTSATSLSNFIERAQAPPRSSTTLYNTTQRIRI